MFVGDGAAMGGLCLPVGEEVFNMVSKSDKNCQSFIGKLINLILYSFLAF